MDEYWDVGSAFEITPAASKEPLALGELIDLIDSARRRGYLFMDNERYDVGLTDCFRYLNWDEGADADDMRVFVRVTSPFYPQLGPYYKQRADDWYQVIVLEQLDDEIQALDSGATSTRIVRPRSPESYRPETLLFPSRRPPRTGERTIDQFHHHPSDRADLVQRPSGRRAAISERHGLPSVLPN